VNVCWRNVALAGISHYNKEIVMGFILTGDQKNKAMRRVGELLQQLGRAEYPHDPEELLESIQALVEKGRLAINFIIEVIYGLAFEAMVAAGHYDHRNPDITEEHFPTLKRGTVKYEAVLVHLNRNASTDEAKAEIERRGLIPASLTELLAFGVKYPDEQRKYPIVAIGQAWRVLDYSYFPCLWDDGRGRCLNLRHVGVGWFGFCLFLALREISS